MQRLRQWFATRPPQAKIILVLAALSPDANKTEIAEKYGISRRWIYFLIDEVMEDPEGIFQRADSFYAVGE